VIASTSIQDLASEEALAAFDLIVLTDSDKDTIASIISRKKRPAGVLTSGLLWLDADERLVSEAGQEVKR